VILSDCTTAIAWAHEGSSPPSKFQMTQLLGRSPETFGVTIQYRHGNLGEQWNTKQHSPKQSKDH